jgi:hypothetical protein
MSLRPLIHSLWGCLLVALLLRFCFLFLLFPTLEKKMTLRDDGDGYMLIAETIHQHQYTDVVRGPVYPYFLAFAKYKLTAKILQVCLDSTVVWALFILGKILRKPFTGIIAAWFYAFYPLAWWRCAFINKETLQTVFLIWFVVLLFWIVNISNKNKPWNSFFGFLVAGFIFGLLNLIKPTFLLFPFFLIFWVWHQRAILSWVCVGVFLFGTLIPVGLWTYRNYKITNELIPVAIENAGLTLFVGGFYPNGGAWEGPSKDQWMKRVRQLAEEHPHATASELNRVYFRVAIKNLVNHPIQSFILFTLKVYRFWFENASGRLGLWIFFIQGAALTLGVIGFLKSDFEVKYHLFFALLIGYLWILHSIIYSELRYSLPLMPIIFLYGGVFVGKLMKLPD